METPALVSSSGGVSSASSAAGLGGSSANAAAVPTLRVMRLQSPELHVSPAGPLTDACCLQTSLCLPDSLGVYVGERFTAYLGILNSSGAASIRKLTVSAQLQSPSARWQLPTGLEPTDVAPNTGIDAIVSHDIEEAGQHILRVEVGYVGADGGSKTFRKFYRFNVVSPLGFRTVCSRFGDSKCFVSVTVEHASAEGATSSTGPAAPSPSSSNAKEALVLASVDFAPADGLTSEPIGSASTDSSSSASALDLLDKAGLVSPGDSRCYLFCVTASSKDAILRGIASGDLLGRTVVTWRKAMGETGRVASPNVHCPAIPLDDAIDLDRSSEEAAAKKKDSNFVVYQSGLSVDVAAAAAVAQSRNLPMDANDLSRRLAVTVEPIDPPKSMRVHVTRTVQFLVVNHSTQPMTLQVRFVLSSMAGVVVCGPSFQTSDNVPPNGGSTVITACFMPLSTGMQTVDGCRVVDLVSGREILQPPLFRVVVDGGLPEGTS
jgi:trafficking protein particle complex subunit 13